MLKVTVKATLPNVAGQHRSLPQRCANFAYERTRTEEKRKYSDDFIPTPNSNTDITSPFLNDRHRASVLGAWMHSREMTVRFPAGTIKVSGQTLESTNPSDQ